MVRRRSRRENVFSACHLPARGAAASGGIRGSGRISVDAGVDAPPRSSRAPRIRTARVRPAGRAIAGLVEAMALTGDNRRPKGLRLPSVLGAAVVESL